MFNHDISQFRRRRGKTLTEADQQHLDRWVADERWEYAWEPIEQKALLVNPMFVEEPYVHSFIEEVLAARNIAELSNQERERRRNYLAHAKEAESLKAFLQESPCLGKLSPVLRGEQLCALLDETARLLREQARSHHVGKVFSRARPMRLSRIDRGGSRPRVVFMEWISGVLQSVCGQPFDEAVAMLTDIAFPGQVTTLEQVRSARRASTRAGRKNR